MTSVYATTDTDIGTAPVIQAHELFALWQGQRVKQSVPILRVRSGAKTYRTAKPIKAVIYKDDGLFFAENENLCVCGYGQTPEEAVSELGLHILHFYRYYRDLSPDRAVGDALRLKKLYSDLLIEEQSCPSTDGE